MHSLIANFLVFTAAAAISVPLFKKLRLGAILGYLFSGILVGPSVLGLITDTQQIFQFSELGVVFLLFIIGLELAPAKLWRLRKSIFGLGAAQVLVTATVLFLLGKLAGISTAVLLVTALGLALSSTAFAMQLLEENHQNNTIHGQGSFAVLMFQDLAVVPLLLLVGYLSGQKSQSFTWNDLAVGALVIGCLILAGRYGIRHILRIVADTRTQEVFTAVTLFIVMGTALLMEKLGLSMGMGAFLAGVLLANSEYRHELETNLLPFKGLLLGLFFIAVGMGLDLSIVTQQPIQILALTLGFMLIKVGVMFLLGRTFKYPKEESLTMAVTLPHGGEFAFVLFSTAAGQGLFTSEWTSLLNTSVTLSMAMAPFFFQWNQKRMRTYFDISEKPFDRIDSQDTEVIVAGYGRFGQIVTRFLSTEGIKFTILEHNAAQVEVARKFGSVVYYGDASREDILHSAGAEKAKYLVLAIDDPAKSVEVAQLVRKRFPNLKIIARVRNRQHAMEMMELGIEQIHRETYLTSLEVAKEVLLAMGKSRDSINKRLAKFRSHDEGILRKQFELRHNEKQMISFTAQANQELQNILQADREENP